MLKNHENLLTQMYESITLPTEIIITRDTELNIPDNYVVLYYMVNSTTPFYLKKLRSFQDVLNEMEVRPMDSTPIHFIHHLSIKEVESLIKTLVFFNDLRRDEPKINGNILRYSGGTIQNLFNETNDKIHITLNLETMETIIDLRCFALGYQGNISKSNRFIDVYRYFYDNYRSSLNLVDDNNLNVSQAIESFSKELDCDLEKIIVGVVSTDTLSDTYVALISEINEEVSLDSESLEITTFASLQKYLFKRKVRQAKIIQNMSYKEAINFIEAIEIYFNIRLENLEAGKLILSSKLYDKANEQVAEVYKLYKEFLECRNQVEFIEIYRRCESLPIEASPRLELTYLN